VLGKNPGFSVSRQSPHAYREMWQKITNPRSSTGAVEIINRRKNSEEVTVHLTVFSGYNAYRTIVGYVASTIDMTARKQFGTGADGQQ